MPNVALTEKKFFNANSRRLSRMKYLGEDNLRDPEEILKKSLHSGHANGRRLSRLQNLRISALDLSLDFTRDPSRDPELVEGRKSAFKKSSSILTKIAFFDIDTQFDFINPRGKLFIKGAPKIVSNLKRLTAFAKKNNITILASLDSHIKNDPEFKIFPAHCLKNNPGQKKITGTQLNKVAIVNMKELKKDKINSLLNKFKQIIIKKNTYTVFTNPNTKRLISKFDIFYVYGVALDYCVRACCSALRKNKKNVFLITDATKEVNSKSKWKVIRELKRKGVKFIKTRDVLSPEIAKTNK